MKSVKISHCKIKYKICLLQTPVLSGTKKDTAGKKKITGSSGGGSGGGRSNSTLSSREVEFQNWKRRKSYDPMKAAAEGKKKEAAKKQAASSPMTQSTNSTITTPKRYIYLIYLLTYSVFLSSCISTELLLKLTFVLIVAFLNASSSALQGLGFIACSVFSSTTFFEDYSQWPILINSLHLSPLYAVKAHLSEFYLILSCMLYISNHAHIS